MRERINYPVLEHLEPQLLSGLGDLLAVFGR